LILEGVSSVSSVLRGIRRGLLSALGGREQWLVLRVPEGPPARSDVLLSHAGHVPPVRLPQGDLNL